MHAKALGSFFGPNRRVFGLKKGNLFGTCSGLVRDLFGKVPFFPKAYRTSSEESPNKVGKTPPFFRKNSNRTGHPVKSGQKRTIPDFAGQGRDGVKNPF